MLFTAVKSARDEKHCGPRNLAWHTGWSERGYHVWWTVVGIGHLRGRAVPGRKNQEGLGLLISPLSTLESLNLSHMQKSRAPHTVPCSWGPRISYSWLWHSSASPWSQGRRRGLPAGWSPREKEEIKSAENVRSPGSLGEGRWLGKGSTVL